MTTSRVKIPLFCKGSCDQENMDTAVGTNEDLECGNCRDWSYKTSHHRCIDKNGLVSNADIAVLESSDVEDDDSDIEQDERRECMLLLPYKNNDTMCHTMNADNNNNNNDNSKHKISKCTAQSSSESSANSSNSSFDGFCDDETSLCSQESCDATTISATTTNSSRSAPFFLAAVMGPKRNHDDRINGSSSSVKTADANDSSSMLHRRQKRTGSQCHNMIIDTNNTMIIEKEQTKRSDNKWFALSYYHIQLLYGTIGIYASYMCYGIVQEQLFTYRCTSTGTGFVYVWFLQVVESAVTILLACIGRRLQLSMSRVISATGSVSSSSSGIGDVDEVVVVVVSKGQPQSKDLDTNATTTILGKEEEEEEDNDDNVDFIETSNRSLKHNSLSEKTVSSKHTNTTGSTNLATNTDTTATTTTKLNNHKNNNITKMPLLPFYKAGTSQLLGKICMNLALSYGHVPFPIVVLTKSAKIIPVMIGQILLGGTSFTAKEYWFALCMVIGTVLLGLNSTTMTTSTTTTTTDVVYEVDKDDHYTLYCGYMFLFLSVLLDGVTGGIQKRIKVELIQWKPTSYDFLYYSHCSMLFVSFMLCCYVRHDSILPTHQHPTPTIVLDGTTTFHNSTNQYERHLVSSLLLSSSSSSTTTTLLSSLYIYYSNSELISGFTYCTNNMSLVYHTIVPMCICSAIGQCFIFYIVAVFDPYINAAITSSRKVCTVLISLLYVGNTTFTNPLYGMFGLCLAMIPVLYEGIIHPFHSIFQEVLFRGQ